MLNYYNIIYIFWKKKKQSRCFNHIFFFVGRHFSGVIDEPLGNIFNRKPKPASKKKKKKRQHKQQRCVEGICFLGNPVSSFYVCEIFIFSPLGAPAEILLLRDDEWDTVQPVAECPPLPEFPFFFSLSLSRSLDTKKKKKKKKRKKTQQHVCTGSITLIVTGHRAAATSLTFRHFLSLSRVYILKEEEEKKKKNPDTHAALETNQSFFWTSSHQEDQEKPPETCRTWQLPPDPNIWCTFPTCPCETYHVTLKRGSAGL